MNAWHVTEAEELHQLLATILKRLLNEENQADSTANERSPRQDNQRSIAGE